MNSKRSYVNYHKHDHVSSIFTPDTPFKAEDFIKRAVELGDKVYFTTNHGSGGDIFEAKTLCDKYELKCLFGIEGYIVPDPLEKDKRNYHIIIIPTTDEARKKVNYVSSHANIDGYYYKPRIFIDDLLALDKDDVYITTACVAGILRDEDSIEKIFIPLANHFGDHMFAEVQAHNVQIQKEHNQKCLEIVEQYGVRLIAATDSHYIYPAQSKDRDLYLKGKGVYYEDEEAFVLDYPDGDTLYKRFVEQGVLSKAQIEDAMRNTFLFADCEEIKIDKEIKMPTIYPNLSSEEKVEELRRHVEGAFEKIKEQEHIPEERLPLYRKRIDEEMKVISDTACINMPDYFLLNERIVNLAVNKYGGVLTRTGRGCFTGEAMVWCKDRLKQIKDVVIGDEVLSEDGKFHTVLDTMKWTIHEPLIQFEYTGQGSSYNVYPNKCTLDHKILVHRNDENIYVPASELRINDLLCSPRVKHSGKKRPVFDLVDYNTFGYTYDNNYIYEIVNTNGTRRYDSYSSRILSERSGIDSQVFEMIVRRPDFEHRPSIKKATKWILDNTPFKTIEEYKQYYIEHSKIRRRINRYIDVDEEFGYFVGMMYGDGWVRNGEDRKCFGIACNPAKFKDVINRQCFFNMCERFGIVDSIYTNKSKTKSLVQYIVHSKVVSNFLANVLFSSKKNKLKSFNTNWLDVDRDILEQIRQGFLHTDGSQNIKEGKLSFDNTSLSIIAAFKYLDSVAGQEPLQFDVRRSWVDNRGYQCKESYKLRRPIERRHPYQQDDNYFYLPISSIKVLDDTTTTVYDLSIDSVHSYVINNVVVHNSCGSFYLNKLLGMTQIDALTAPVPVYSSRFISTARCLENRSMADIDYNVVSQKPFQDASKELLGEHGCYPMVAYGTMELSEAFRNTCRASELPYAQYNDIAKAVESHAEEPKWKPYIDEAKTFIGSIVSVSPHPCAHILMDKDLRYEYGVVRIGDALCVMITSSEADEYKVLKDDFLIVSVWKLISETFEMLGKPIMTVKELEENLDDKVWNLFRDGITATLNQVDGSWATDLAKQYKIHSVREAAMFTAALRPSFDSWRTKFINREKYSTGCEQLDEVLKPTGSYILFQENLMQFFEWLGVTPAESIGLIKKISKKKIKQEDFDSLEGRLHKQWIANVGNDDKFKDVWDMIQSCISYGFCVSGDTVLNRVGYRQCTVEELYNKCNGDYGEGYSLCNDKIIQNTIEDIHFTGIRETYRITLDNLAHIDCTANHKFPTPNGIFETKDLHIGDTLYNVVGEHCNTKLRTNKIVSITPVGKKRVYAVTMAHPNHTYVANGIVTCNCSAHGLATGLDMLYGAYLKSHYPCEYYTVCLNTYKEKHGKVSMLISEMKYFGVKLLPPNINKSRQDFTASNGNILYGLSGIVGVGNVFGDAIVTERDANGKFMNLNDFISRMKPSVSQMVALIKSGAVPTKDKEKMLLKYFKMSLPEQKPYKPVSSLPSKARLLLDYNIDVNVVTDKEERLAIVNSIKQKAYEEKQQETFKKKAEELSSKYMTNPEFWEFETLSVFLTDNPFEGVLPYINLMFADAADGQQCTIVGAVSGVTKKKDKNKNTFAFVNINSIEGFLELTCWAGQYKKYSDLLTRGQQLAVLVKKNQDKAIIQDVKPYRQWLADRKIDTKRSKKEGG